MDFETFSGLLLVITICFIIPWGVGIFGAWRRKAQEKEHSGERDSSDELKQAKKTSPIAGVYNAGLYNPCGVLDEKSDPIDLGQYTEEESDPMDSKSVIDAKRQRELLKSGIITKAEYHERMRVERK